MHWSIITPNPKGSQQAASTKAAAGLPQSCVCSRSAIHRLSILEARDREHVKLIEQQAKRIAELEKKNPTQRLDEAYSLKAEDKRREDAQQRGKSKKRSRSPHGADESQRLKNWPSPLMQKMCGRANIR